VQIAGQPFVMHSIYMHGVSGRFRVIGPNIANDLFRPLSFWRQGGRTKRWTFPEWSRIRRSRFLTESGGLAQLVARMLSMHEVAGSIPAISIFLDQLIYLFVPVMQYAWFELSDQPLPY
jgi:hypothetical protein